MKKFFSVLLKGAIFLSVTICVVYGYTNYTRHTYRGICLLAFGAELVAFWQLLVLRYLLLENRDCNWGFCEDSAEVFV